MFAMVGMRMVHGSEYQATVFEPSFSSQFNELSLEFTGKGTSLVKEGNITGCDGAEALSQPSVLGSDQISTTSLLWDFGQMTKAFKF